MKALKFVQLVVLAMAASMPLLEASALEPGNWNTTWTANPQPVWSDDFVLPTRVPLQLSNQTVRETARISIGGERLRIVLSNEFGSTPLQIGAVNVALVNPEAGIVPASNQPLTFGGARAVTIPPGARVTSDPADLATPALSSIAASVFIPDVMPVSTFHWDGLQTTLIGDGNLTGVAAFKPVMTVPARIFMSDVLVENGGNQNASNASDAPGVRTVVAFGDSITDGAASTMDKNRRWPDYLAQRLAADEVAVLNAGISGARLLSDKMASMP
jgi:hypothetical protein